MPRHNHTFKRPQWFGADKIIDPMSRSVYSWRKEVFGTTEGYGGIAYENGGNQPHNNMPPFLTVYMWERIS